MIWARKHKGRGDPAPQKPQEAQAPKTVAERSFLLALFGGGRQPRPSISRSVPEEA